jgi:hypothetical protein
MITPSPAARTWWAALAVEMRRVEKLLQCRRRTMRRSGAHRAALASGGGGGMLADLAEGKGD